MYCWPTIGRSAFGFLSKPLKCPSPWFAFWLFLARCFIKGDNPVVSSSSRAVELFSLPPNNWKWSCINIVPPLPVSLSFEASCSVLPKRLELKVSSFTIVILSTPGPKTSGGALRTFRRLPFAPFKAGYDKEVGTLYTLRPFFSRSSCCSFVAILWTRCLNYLCGILVFIWLKLKVDLLAFWK